MTTKALGILALAVLLAGCGGGPGNRGVVANLFGGAGDTPDEFLVLPRKPLEEPPSYDTLPEPIPGAVSRTDLTPRTDAVAALGGRPGAGAGADGALLAATGAGRTPADIRATLAAEDAEWRKRNRGLFFERIFLRNKERITYGEELLDADAEAARLKARGVRVPAYPPRAE